MSPLSYLESFPSSFSPQTAQLTEYELFKRKPSGTEHPNLGSMEVNACVSNERKEEELWDKQDFDNVSHTMVYLSPLNI